MDRREVLLRLTALPADFQREIERQGVETRRPDPMRQGR
jgi:hypothetical protein